MNPNKCHVIIAKCKVKRREDESKQEIEKREEREIGMNHSWMKRREVTVKKKRKENERQEKREKVELTSGSHNRFLASSSSAFS